MQQLGRVLFAVGFAGLGVLSLLFQDFAFSYQPVPEWLPGRGFVACVSGLILLVGGVGLFIRTMAARAALGLTVFVAIWQLVLHAPTALAKGWHVGGWLNFSENLLLVGGGWLIFLSLTGSARNRRLRIGQIIFALGLPVLGTAHFVYASVTASMVPGWLPFHLGIAYLTGAGHLATTLGLLSGVCHRLAAILEAIMITLFAVLLHAAGVAADPASRSQWTMFFAVIAFSGAAWAVAGSITPRGTDDPATA